jgi:hypothetical protein
MNWLAKLDLSHATSLMYSHGVYRRACRPKEEYTVRQGTGGRGPLSEVGTRHMSPDLFCLL